jgi:hypothetical protein
MIFIFLHQPFAGQSAVGNVAYEAIGKDNFDAVQMPAAKFIHIGAFLDPSNPCKLINQVCTVSTVLG